MSIQDDIHKLRGIASSERIPIETLRGIQGDILVVNAEVKDILGEGHGFYHGIGARAAALSAALDTAIGAAQGWESSIHDAADNLEQQAGG